METRRFCGSPTEIGHAHGSLLRPVLADRYEQYMRRFAVTGFLDVARVERDAIAWYDQLPARYRQESAAIAEGAGISLATMAKCQFASYATTGDPVRACTSIVASIGGNTWIAHNNDWFDCGSRSWIYSDSARGSRSARDADLRLGGRRLWRRRCQRRTSVDSTQWISRARCSSRGRAANAVAVSRTRSARDVRVAR